MLGSVQDRRFVLKIFVWFAVSSWNINQLLMFTDNIYFLNLYGLYSLNVGSFLIRSVICN